MERLLKEDFGIGSGLKANQAKFENAQVEFRVILLFARRRHSSERHALKYRCQG